jgi:hypothetical protein
MGASGVCLVFPRSRDGHPNQSCRDRCEDQHHERSDATGAPLVPAASGPTEHHGPAPHAGSHGNGTGDRGRYRTDEDVAVYSHALTRGPARLLILRRSEGQGCLGSRRLRHAEDSARWRKHWATRSESRRSWALAAQPFGSAVRQSGTHRGGFLA